MIPLFHDQIASGGPVTITTPEMTRFLLSLDEAVDAVFAAASHALPGETLVPDVPSALVVDIASALIGERDIETRVIGMRPGEKVHEILISEEEAPRSVERDGWYVVRPMLPELQTLPPQDPIFADEYSSAHRVLSPENTTRMLYDKQLLVDQVAGDANGELLR